MRNSDAIDDPLARLVASVHNSARHRSICREVVERVGAIELGKRKSWKEAENETRKHLHRICGSYLDGVPPYDQWLAILETEADPEAFRSQLRRMMLCHASTRERLPFIEEFYSRALQSVGAVRSILDIGCGFNPLSIPWMNLECEGAYEGYDIFSDMTGFLEAAIQAMPDSMRPDIRMFDRDASIIPPATAADVALVLKFLPLLDHKNGEQTLSWLRQLKTRYVVVSFPTRTLGGRNVGMARYYEARYHEVLEMLGWSAERFEIGNELCFVSEVR